MIGPRAQQVKSVPAIGVPFAPIPHEILQRRDISSLAKLVFAVIANHARMRHGDSSPITNAQIAEAVGASVSAVRRALDELETAGLIERRFGASERVRASVAITFSPGRVARQRTTPAAQPARTEQPGCSPATQGVVRPCATPYTKNEERSENALAFDPREGKIELDPKPSPAEIAEALRAMTAGRYAPAMFEAEPGGLPIAIPPTTSKGVFKEAPVPIVRVETKGVRKAHTLSPGGSPVSPPLAGTPQPPDVATMARRVGFSAFVAAGLQKRDDGKPPWKAREGSTYQTLKEAQGARRPRNGRAPRCS